MCLSDLEYICDHMREIDRAEILGLRPSGSDLRSVAWETYEAGTTRGLFTVFYAETSEPVAACGAVELRPGVFYAFCYGTDRFWQVVKEITRWIQSELVPFLKLRAHRVECQSRADHVEAHRWLIWLGARQECILRGYGRDGSDYLQFAWVKG